MRRNARPCRPTGRSSDWNSVQKRSHDKMCVGYGDAPIRDPSFHRFRILRHIHAAPRWKEGFVSSLAAYPAIGACGQRRHSINIRQIRGTDGAAVWDGFGVYALRSAVSLAVTIACVIWLYIS